MKELFRFALLFLTVLSMVPMPVPGAVLRIGDGSGGSALNPLRRALIKLAGSDKGGSVSDSEYSIVKMSAEEALRKFSAKEVELIVLEVRDIPSNFSGVVKFPFAAEALVCYTGSGNPLQSLSVRQLKEIWAADRPVWRKYNGEFNDIHRLGLDFHCGGFTEARFLGGSLRMSGVFRSRNIKNIWLFCSASALLCAPWSVDRPSNVVPVEIDGVKPSESSIVSGKYPLNLRYVLIGRTPLVPEADKFIKLLKSPEYSVIIRDSGLIPMKDSGTKP